MSRYDPDPTEPYGVCTTCGEEIADPDAMSAHFAKVREEGPRGHSVRVSNLTRIERIENKLNSLVESALYDFISEAERLLDADVTEEEIASAMSMLNGDFADAWGRRND